MSENRIHKMSGDPHAYDAQLKFALDALIVIIFSTRDMKLVLRTIKIVTERIAIKLRALTEELGHG